MNDKSTEYHSSTKKLYSLIFVYMVDSDQEEVYLQQRFSIVLIAQPTNQCVPWGQAMPQYSLSAYGAYDIIAAREGFHFSCTQGALLVQSLQLTVSQHGLFWKVRSSTYDSRLSSLHPHTINSAT